MEAYTDFALVYDTLMDNTPYERWCEIITGILKRYGIEKELVLDLGCGTGTLTELLAKEGYDMIGVDFSEEMLNRAIEKREESGLQILYLLQDMREFELFGTVKAVISVCDSLNYLLEEEDIIETFRLVNNYLDPKGLFIFDFNTVYKYRDIIGDTTIAENRDDCSFIWENYYHEEERINEYDVTFFIKEGELFRRFEETHYQRGYTAEEMKVYLERAGLEFVSMQDADTLLEVTEESQRIYMIAREKGKTDCEAV
ncbi:MAG: class I SAM-dependent methyltransferase [Lachnospiraceae bacterium]|nr:class I SAM-dependent methyltransferase [Lachnospiraceae bacterium]